VDSDVLGPFGTFLGLEIGTATGDEVTGTWSAEPRLHQPYGIVHGGIHCSIVETLASIGADLWYGEVGNVVGVSNSTDFFRAVSEGRLTSVARPLHRGRSQQVWVVETTDDDGCLVSRGQVRLQNLARRTPASD
jgi:1,4-dihydroxy-2-naphthoyl-CoA hydrolase